MVAPKPAAVGDGGDGTDGNATTRDCSPKDAAAHQAAASTLDGGGSDLQCDIVSSQGGASDIPRRRGSRQPDGSHETAGSSPVGSSRQRDGGSPSSSGGASSDHMGGGDMAGEHTSDRQLAGDMPGERTSDRQLAGDTPSATADRLALERLAGLPPQALMRIVARGVQDATRPLAQVRQPPRTLSAHNMGRRNQAMYAPVHDGRPRHGWTLRTQPTAGVGSLLQKNRSSRPMRSFRQGSLASRPPGQGGGCPGACIV